VTDHRDTEEIVELPSRRLRDRSSAVRQFRNPLTPDSCLGSSIPSAAADNSAIPQFASS